MHQPVLLEETITNLVTNPHGIYVDGTLGGGGHLTRLMASLADDAMVIALDKDNEILKKTASQFKQSNIIFIHADFRHMATLLSQQGINQVDGIMLDLGVSSFQLDIADRGFSFHHNSRLDMRMDRSQDLTAWDIVNCFDEEELSHILETYGEEKYSRFIARNIVKQRQQKTIDSTLELVEVIRAAVPARYSREKHPARRTFQALRIAVNSELDALKQVLPQIVELLKPQGRLCIITFHSLEDRMVKKFIQEEARECICPPGQPVCTCDTKPRLRIAKRKPFMPSPEECENNPRARSARLRTAIKL